MRIGELSSATGVSVRSLCYYQEQGLLTAGRGECGHRLYPPGAAEQVLLINIEDLIKARGLLDDVLLSVSTTAPPEGSSRGRNRNS